MWAQGRYDLGLSEDEFWRLTPKQFHLLYDRHREAMLHREMTAAFTTAAVINSSMCAPKDGVGAIEFMPNHPSFTNRESPTQAISEEKQVAHADYMAKVLQLAAELKQGHGPLLTKIKEESCPTPQTSSSPASMRYSQP
ncbi:hypothetical protein [Terriglobus roseus]|uniref:Uncharacterized protein n=1 Tax=Terriglobus roseus TaxID=392734 RepID=A0A1H4J3L5_9BACT|nr:hypothetical protein [Terriglobus roseus]SEB40655.1 hypothetical protein SAMN05443244_0323 [Terriglobus roseus]